jgi:hypothetical protein
MSRSVRHIPITGVTTATSEKFSKRLWNRAYRYVANRSEDPGRDVRNGDGSKDGKMFWRGMLPDGLMRK